MHMLHRFIFRTRFSHVLQNDRPGFHQLATKQCWYPVKIEQLHKLRSGIMVSANQPCVIRNESPLVLQRMLTNHLFIGIARHKARVGTSLPVMRSIKGGVHTPGTMAQNQDDLCKAVPMFMKVRARRPPASAKVRGGLTS